MRGLRLGRVFGIQLLIDPSWFLIFFLVVFNLSTYLTALHPEWTFALRLGLAVVAALLFFASVLIHELAHSLMAIRLDVPVKNITLFLFGGVANIQREPPSPRAEFLITIVGPIASFVLGVLFTLAGIGLGGLQNLGDNPQAALANIGPIASILLWLGSINILLAIFNMLPGFPLDGGRVLRSILWGITGNLRKATRWAGRVGQVVAYLFIIGGVLSLFGFPVPLLGQGNFIGGLWFIFIGWFLNNAAQQSYRQVVMRDLVEGVPVARVMRQDAPTVKPNQSVNQLVHDQIMGTDHHAFPVLRDDQLVGIVCLHDVRRVPRDQWDMTSVQAIMTPADQLATTQPDEDLADAIERLVRREVGQLPVVQTGHYVGLLRQRDIARWIDLQSQT